ncbi:hypothetical protein C1646_810894 [Rhizophagus diaphanus]|nr:hypothetical protein C1646_810894 [Rhizophagus diaphanus] [Rhizophagus sp. MUCL 43196]
MSRDSLLIKLVWFYEKANEWESFKELTKTYTETDIKELRRQKLLSTGKGKKEIWTRLEVKAKRWEREYPEESSDGRDSLMVISVGRKEIFISYVEKNRIGILCSPPSSGKNTLGEYFRDYHNDIYIILAGMICEGEETKRKEFDAFWMGKSNTGCNENLWILFLGMHHPTLADNPTPAEFTHSCSWLGLNETLVFRNVKPSNMLFICRDNDFHHVDVDLNFDIAKRFIKSGAFARSLKINFKDFLVRTIERLPSKLINSLGKGIDSYLFKRGWQMEWDRTATTVVPMDATVNADVDKVFGSSEFLDSYINGNYY